MSNVQVYFAFIQRVCGYLCAQFTLWVSLLVDCVGVLGCCLFVYLHLSAYVFVVVFFRALTTTGGIRFRKKGAREGGRNRNKEVLLVRTVLYCEGVLWLLLLLSVRRSKGGGGECWSDNIKAINQTLRVHPLRPSVPPPTFANFSLWLYPHLSSPVLSPLCSSLPPPPPLSSHSSSSSYPSLQVWSWYLLCIYIIGQHSFLAHHL